MKLDKDYTGQITKAMFVKKAFKGPEEKKEYKRVGIIQTEIDYQDGDLDSFIDPVIADNRNYKSCSWDEIVGTYELDINDVISDVKIIGISRKNKNDIEGTLSITFETENMDNVSTIGNYLKDKDTPANIKISPKK
jgi:hypothetical protein